MTENKYFKEALGNMTREAAYAAAVCHLTDLGYSARKIEGTLTFPAPYESIRRIAFEHMLKTGILLREDPAVKKPDTERVEYVLEEGSFGRKSFRRIRIGEDEKTGGIPYIPCDFGLFDEEILAKIKNVLTSEEWNYIDGIPWDGKRMYHRQTPLMCSIMDKIEDLCNEGSKD